MSVTLTEILDQLQDYLDDYPELANEPVNIAYQRQYPLAAEITAINVLDGESDEECECAALDTCSHQIAPSLWIATEDNTQDPYAPKAAWRS